MAGKLKIAPRSRSAKIPPVSITFRRRGQTLYYQTHSLDCLSRLAIAVLSPGSGDRFLLCRLAVPVLLCQSFNSCASSGSEYDAILT